MSGVSGWVDFPLYKRTVLLFRDLGFLSCCKLRCKVVVPGFLVVPIRGKYSFSAYSRHTLLTLKEAIIRKCRICRS